MTERVKIVVSRTNGQLRPDIDTEDPHRDDLSALDAYRLFMPQDLQERLAVEMARTGMDGGGGIDGQPVTGSTTPKVSPDIDEEGSGRLRVGRHPVGSERREPW